MGLLKKRPETEVEVTGAPEPAVAPTDDAAELAPADTAEAEVTALDPATLEAEPPAEPAPDASDALLQVFQDAQHEGEDRSMLVEMAGDVELADLMDELATAAAALGIVVARASIPAASADVAA